MKNLTNKSSRVLKLEHLEQRLALAGDVVIASDGGNLAIVGDAHDNQVEIRTVDPLGGQAVIGRADTRLVVDGQPVRPNQPVFVGAITGITNVLLADGDDLLIMNGARLGSTEVSTGAGADVVLMTPGTVIGGSLAIDLAEGNDRLAARHAVVRGQLGIDSGTGDDFLQFGHTAAGGVGITTGAGQDHVRLADNCFGQLGVDLGEDSDALVMTGTHVAGHTAVFGGAGVDWLVAIGNRLPHLHVGGFEHIRVWASAKGAAAEQQPA